MYQLVVLILFPVMIKTSSWSYFTVIVLLKLNLLTFSPTLSTKILAICYLKIWSPCTLI